ncbi:MAG: hypothetical protein JXA82_09480 [Sedimentisphaerales bacterium]|nr:hypothetical protein [Sedimentisphaerales bacterium]
MEITARHNGLTTEKFSEELYFMLLSTTMRKRVEALGAKYGLDGDELRSTVLQLTNQLAKRTGQLHRNQHEEVDFLSELESTWTV